MKKIIYLFINIFITFFLSNIDAVEAINNVTTKQLKNGLKLILVENHSSPMIASVITVNSGSVNETAEINGISHMLEHLLFNGTISRTQEQLYSEQDFYGIYNNAHTDRDYTNYIVLVEKDFIEKAFDIQSDMLFNSIFPKPKFEKEKGIILNELARDSSNDSYWAEEFFNRKFYKGTPFNLTILGTPSSIKQIKRNQVIKYYQTFYKPNNMTALVMGDFDPAEMINLFESYFGKQPPGKIPEAINHELSSNIIEKTYLQKIESNNVYLNIGFAAPKIGSKDFYSFDLLSRVLNLRLKNDFKKRLKGKIKDRLQTISSDFNFSKSLSTFVISAVLPVESNPELIKNEIYHYLKEFINEEFDEQEIKGLLTSLEVNEQFLYEKPHYYGMMKGQWLAAGGWEFTESYIDRLANVTIKELKKTGKKYFSNPQFFTSITLPGDKKPEFVFNEYYASNNTKIEFTEESARLIKLWGKMETAPGKKAKAHLPGENSKDALLHAKEDKRESIVSNTRKFEKTVFENGLTLLINSNPDSRVFAIHLLAKNRTALEPQGKEGIAGFLHRLMAVRTGARDKKQLQASLNAIGAKLKTTDNPYIPYDDYYRSREFSYIRFETIDKYYKEAINVYSDIILNPFFSEEEINNVKEKMLHLIKKENDNPSKIASNILYEELFNKNIFSRRIIGTEKSISSITEKGLKIFYKYYFSPNNLIISVSTSIDREKVLKEFEKYFKSIPKVKTPAFSKIDYPKFSKAKLVKHRLNKNQSYIRLGTLFKIAEDEGAGLRVLSSILSQKLSQNLREKKGLAYSLGAGFSTRKDYGLFQIAVGTRPDTLNEVEKDIYKEIEQIKREEVSSDKLSKLINLYNSRRLMRSLTRIGQSYQSGLNELYGRPYNYNQKLLQEIKNLNSEVVRNLAKKYLKRDNMVKVIVE